MRRLHPRSAERLIRFKEGKIKQLKFGRPSNMTPAKEREAREMLGRGVDVGKTAGTLRLRQSKKWVRNGSE